MKTTEEYTEVEGMLYRAGVDFIKNDNSIIPADITILKPREQLKYFNQHVTIRQI